MIPTLALGQIGRRIMLPSGGGSAPLLIALGSHIITSANGGVAWTNQGSIGGTSRCVTKSGSIMVTGQDSGLLKTSTDGLTWTARTANQGTRNLLAAVHGPSGFAVFGDFSGGYGISKSTDGITWTAVSPYPSAFAGVISAAYFAGKYIVGDNGGKTAYSTDLVTWTGVTMPSGGGVSIRGLAHDGTTIVAVGDSGRCWTSTDGVTWTYRGPIASSGTMSSVTAIGLGQFVAVTTSGGIVAKSTDSGATWTNLTLAGTPPSGNLLFSSSKIIGVSATTHIRTSPDGAAWTQAFNLAGISLWCLTEGL